MKNNLLQSLLSGQNNDTKCQIKYGFLSVLFMAGILLLSGSAKAQITFSSKVDFTANAHPSSVEIADFDGDGKKDIVVVNGSSNNISVYRNTSTSGSLSSGSFAAKVDFSTGSNPYNVRVADIDGDGKLDIVVSNNGSSSVSVFINTATSGTISSSSFAAKVDFTTASGPEGVSISDFDHDGKLDIVAACSGSTVVSVLKNTTSGTVSFATKVDFTAPASAWGVATGDIDGDGWADIIVAHDGGPATFSILRNTTTTGVISTGSFAAKVDFPTGGTACVSVALADIDGDGKLDVIIGNYSPSTISVMRNTATSGTINSASMATNVDFTSGSSPFYLATGDINGDGKQDIITDNFGGSSVSVFANTATSGTISSSSLSSKVDFTSGSSPWGVAVGDLDGDGMADIVTANAFANTISVLRNTSAPPITFNGGSPQNFKVCQNASATSINTLLTASAATGATFTWSVTATPAHGTMGGFPATASSGTSITPSGLTYTPTSGYSGIDAFTIQVSNGTSITTTTVNVTVQAPPTSISGSTFAICGTGNTITLSDAITGGTWSSSATSIATVGTSSGVVTSASAGTTIITYSTGCGTAATQTVTVGVIPASISGTANACTGNTATLTDATAFGAWSSGISSVATVGSSTGIVTGIASGTTTITYTTSVGCTATTTFTVNVTPASITGAGGILCATNTLALSDVTSSGIWSSSSTSVATVNSSGLVTGVSGGNTTISYTSASGCSATQAISVTALPTVSGGSNVAICPGGAGTTLTASGAVIYTWAPSTGLSSTNGTSVTANPTTTTTYTVSGSTATVGTQTFNYSGSTQTWAVPAGVTSLSVDMSGAGGGQYFNGSSFGPGGYGGRVTGTLAVTPGQVLNVYVGGAGSDGISNATAPGGFNGGGNGTNYSIYCGGGGGGATDIRIGGVALSNRLIVAAGGGGAGYYYGFNKGGDGGNTTGQAGVFNGVHSGVSGTGAGAGTPSAGGAAGSMSDPGAGISGSGSTGALGVGGTGTTASNVWTAGGGGGYYGGGSAPGGSAGGGSSYTDAVLVTGAAHTQGYNSSGNGVVAISYNIPGCTNTALVTVSVNTLPSAIGGTNGVCPSATTTLSDATAFGAWSSSNTTVATIGASTGTVSGLIAGTTTISYTLSTGCNATKIFTVNPNPAAITGSVTAVCASGGTTTLSDATSGGAWSSSNTTVATVNSSALVTGVAGGTASISYTLPAGCGAFTTVTVYALPTPSLSTTSACVGALMTVTTGLLPGDSIIWKNSSTYIKTTLPNSFNITSITKGDASITTMTGARGDFITPGGDLYVVDNGNNRILKYPAGFTSSTVATVVAQSGLGNPWGVYVDGSGYIYVANPDIYNNVVRFPPTSTSSTTGTVVAQNGLAGCTDVTMDPSGNIFVADVDGTRILEYPAGSNSSTVPTNISNTFCFGIYVDANDTLYAADFSGNQILKFAPTSTFGVYNTPVGVGGGSSGSGASQLSQPTGVWFDAQGYMYVTDHGNNRVQKFPPRSVNGTAAVTVAGAGGYGSGSTQLEQPFHSVVDASTNIYVADESNNRVQIYYKGTSLTSDTLTAATSGSYTATVYRNGCTGTTSALTINSVSPISGPANVCAGLTTTLSDATTGGTWISSNNTVATIGTSSGIVTSYTAGTAIVSYTSTAGCIATRTETVNPLPVAISGTSNVCLGLTTGLSDVNTGGTWASSNTSIATINSSGVATGQSVGTTTITYTLPTGCQNTLVLTVNPLPSNITGTATVCELATTTLSDATSFGVWSSGSTANATVNSVSGLVTGVLAGTATITYKLTTGCIATSVVTVNSTPAITAGTTVVCVGLTTTLTGSGFGNWSSSNTALAAVGSGTGIVTGVAGGLPSISYTLANGCYASKVVTVNPVPTTILGTMSACIGATSALSDTTGTGTWSSSATTIATVNSSTGLVTGVAAGTTTITYTLAATGCYSTRIFTTNPFPTSITGTPNTCPGSTTTLADASPFGNWSSSNTAVATIGSGTGVVTGVVAGTTTITYTLATGCTTTAAVTVNPLPANISGTPTVCAGLTTGLSDATTGGNWTTNNTTVATVGFGSGIVTGVVAGTTTITYTLGTGCQSMANVTVNPLPSAISGTLSVCAGLTTGLSNVTGTGTWTSGTTAVATINSTTGLVNGVTAGTSVITYTIPTGCISTAAVTVNPLPASISGTTNVCVGLTTGLSDATPFGGWSSSVTSVATIGAGTGITTGILAGTTTITYTIGATGCIATTQLTVNPLPAAISGSATVCAGLSTSYTDATALGTWTSSNTSVATVNSGTGLVNGVVAGTATITYTLPTGCINTQVITVNPLPANISGSLAVCNGLSTTLSDATLGGTWTSSDPTKATINASSGVMTGLAIGNPTITYMLGTGCIATGIATVNPLPAAITGTMNVCVGLTTTLSDATPSGVWSSSNTSVATTASNVVTGVLAGTATITYTLPTGCIMTTVMTVNPLPAAIGGTTNVCVGSATALNDATPFGTWSSSNTTNATVIVATGVVSGLNAGTTTITYSLSTGCIITTPVTVNPLPGVINGTPTVCVGLTTALSDAGGGTWTSSNTVAATIAGTGIVTGIAPGTTTITYTLATGCTSLATVTVNPLPAAISGPSAVCAGLNITLTDAGGGTWASSNTSVATINSSGVLSGLVAGTTTVTYTLPVSGCIMTSVVTVNPLPGTITGVASVCVGLNTTLSDAGGGTWSSSNLSLAVVGTSSGIVTGMNAGTLTVTYTLPTGCINTTLFTVNPLPAAISGTMNVCVGLTTALSDAGGGAWTSSNTNVATINGSGVATGVLAGTTTITYTLPTSCIITSVLTVNPLPANIVGPNNVCLGLTTSVSDPTPFGIWSSSNTAVATIASGTGFINGISAGSTTLTYQLSTGCVSTMAFTVNPLPTAILGSPTVCAGLSTPLSDASPLGAWSSGNTSVATIVSGTGVLTGLVAGTSVITYTLPTTCIITMTETVNPLPAAITGATTHVCAGLAITMSDATPLGSWSTSNTSVATVGSSSGIVNGLVAGTATLTYTLPTSCIMTTIITVDPLPAAITGTMSVCAGLTTTLSDVTAGGTWSSSNTAIATVSANVVTGVVAGTATITYTLPTSCIMTSVVTVNPLPAAITGTTNVCAGLTTTLSDATALGTWSSSATSIATIGNTTGIVNGVVAGTATVTYKLTTTGCIMTTPVTVNPLPATITGATTHVCAGLAITMSDATSAGSWSISNTSVATVNSSTGVVNGLVAGTVTLTYTLPTSCIMTTIITVDPLPAAITGTMNVCAGLSTALSDATPSGAWSSSNTAVATVAGNVVTGVVAGTATITYTLPTGCIMTTVMTVNPLPANITGVLNVCPGTSSTASDITPGGTWSNDLSLLVTPLTINSSTGVITGLTAGTNIITYTLPTGCIATKAATVNPLPAAITGNSHVCAGLTTVFSDATSGGSWLSDRPAKATINPTTGLITGVSNGLALITYTLPTGCMAIAPITVDSLPLAITGNTHVCAGLTTTLSDASVGGLWTVATTSVATVNATSGVISGITAGTTRVTYTLSTGCIMTNTVTVDPLPAAITGTMNVCAGLTTTLSNATTGGSWTSGNTAIATVDATLGTVTGVTAGTVQVTYTLPTGCIMNTMVTVNPLPSTIIGTKNVCAGSTTTLTDAGGGSWISDNSSVASVSGGIVSGITYGTANITYVLPTGCITSSVVTVDSVPTVFTVAGGGNYCPGTTTGVHVLLTGSVSLFTYQLYRNGIAIGTSPTIGTGLGLDFGTQTGIGTYTVVAKDPLTSCTSNMLSLATVSLYPMPAAHAVTGGGNYCAGGTGVHVGLTSGDFGDKYQLYMGTTADTLVRGAGVAIDFGLKTVADSYTVVAIDTTTGCFAKMPGKALVGINPLLTPSVTVTYPTRDTICAGTPITFTATPTNGGTAPVYTWQVNGVNKSATSTYTYVPNNADVVGVILRSNAICPSPDTAIASVMMPIIAISHPDVTITSDHGDTLCAGTVVTYTATTKFGGSGQVMTWVKNGIAVDSGYTYTYAAKDGDIIYNTLFSNYRCRDTNRVFSNNITMTVDSSIIPSVTVSTFPGVTVKPLTYVIFTADAVDAGTAPTYQWYRNQNAISGATNITYSSASLIDGDSITVRVMRSDACGKTTFNGVKMHIGNLQVLQTSANNSSISVMPNPNKGEFTVKGTLGVSNDETVTLELTNMLGQLVHRSTTVATGGNLDARVKISNTLANGMYLLNVHSDAASQVFHVVIEQ